MAFGPILLSPIKVITLSYQWCWKMSYLKSQQKFPGKATLGKMVYRKEKGALKFLPSIPTNLGISES